MNGHGYDTGQPAGRSRRYVDRLVVGTPAEVRDVIRSTMERGRLVAMTAPRPAGTGKVAVRVRMLPPTPGATRDHTAVGAPTRPARDGLRSRWPNPGTVAAVVAAAVAAGTVIGFTVFWLIKAVWPVLVALAVIVFWLRRR